MTTPSNAASIKGSLRPSAWMRERGAPRPAAFFFPRASMGYAKSTPRMGARSYRPGDGLPGRRPPCPSPDRENKSPFLHLNRAEGSPWRARARSDPRRNLKLGSGGRRWARCRRTSPALLFSRCGSARERSARADEHVGDGGPNAMTTDTQAFRLKNDMSTRLKSSGRTIQCSQNRRHPAAASASQ